MIDVRGYDEFSSRDLAPYEFRVEFFILGCKFHLLGDDSLFGVVELRRSFVTTSFCDPFLPHHFTSFLSPNRFGSQSFHTGSKPAVRSMDAISSGVLLSSK